MKLYFLYLFLLLVPVAFAGDVKLDDIQLQIENPKNAILDPVDTINLRLQIKTQNDTRVLALMAEALRLGMVGENQFADFKPRQRLAIYALTEDNSPNLKNPEACLEFARIMGQDTPVEAILFVDELGQKSQGRQRIWAAETCADIALKAKRYEMAFEYYKLAEAFCKVQYAIDDPLVKLALERIQLGIRIAARVNDVKKFGEDYVLYREAELLRRKEGQPAKAIELYRKIEKDFAGSVFSEAARLYEGLCLSELGRVDEAERRLIAFVQSDRLGLYRGEALLELGRIALERRIQPALARQRLDELENWFKAVDQAGPTQSELRLNPDTAKVSTPPGQEKKQDRFGNIKKEFIAPGELVNEKTCRWYLNDLKEQCATLRGFLFLCDGHKKEALQCFQRILETDPGAARLQSRGDWNNYSRLKWGAENGYLYGYPEEIAPFEGSAKLAVMLADFYYCTENFEKSTRLYERLLKGDFGKLSPLAREFPQFGYASSIYYLKGREDALPEYEKVLVKRFGTFTEDRASYCLGNVSLESTSPERVKNALPILRELAESPRHNEFTHKARIVCAQQYLENKLVDKAREVLKRIPASAETYRAIADYLLDEFSKTVKTDVKESNKP